MLVEYLLKIVLVMVFIAINQIVYNTVVYKQLGYLRWIKFVISFAITLTISGFIWLKIHDLVLLPYVSSAVNMIDKIIFTFFSYIPKSFILLWFVVPIVIAWIFYLLMALKDTLVIRWRFYRWQKKNESEELKQANKAINEGAEKEKEESKDVVEEKVSLEMEDVAEENQLPFFDVPINKIKYNSVLGLQRSYELAKTEGLQVDMAEWGYVAVYANGSGKKQLRALLAENDINDNGLENRPSLVAVKNNGIESISIKDALKRIKDGDSIDFSI